MDDFHLCKNYYNMGKSLDKCFDCEYCFIKGYKYENMIYPDDVNVPVSVNAFYGDPMLQIDTTIEILEGLEKRKHKGKVILLTKGDFSKMPDRKFNLDLWYGFSAFGIDHKMHGGTIKQLDKNIKIAKKRKLKCFIKFAPVIEGLNNTDEAIDNIAKYNIPVSYMGMNCERLEIELEKKIKRKCNAYRYILTLTDKE